VSGCGSWGRPHGSLAGLKQPGGQVAVTQPELGGAAEDVKLAGARVAHVHHDRLGRVGALGARAGRLVGGGGRTIRPPLLAGTRDPRPRDDDRRSGCARPMVTTSIEQITLS